MVKQVGNNPIRFSVFIIRGFGTFKVVDREKKKNVKTDCSKNIFIALETSIFSINLLNRIGRLPKNGRMKRSGNYFGNVKSQNSGTECAFSEARRPAASLRWVTPLQAET